MIPPKKKYLWYIFSSIEISIELGFFKTGNILRGRGGVAALF